MKQSTAYYILPFLLLSLFLPSTVSANVHVSVEGNGDNAQTSVSVNQQGSTQSTTCVNGSCSTSGATGKTEVCTNGECKTYDGNVDYKSDNGNTKINVQNTTSIIQITPSSKLDDNQSDDDLTVTPSVSPSVVDKQKHAEKHAQVKNEIKHLSKSHEAFLSNFLKKEMDSLQQLFSKFFKQDSSSR